MPGKQGTRAEVNTFVQGLITEASPLNFPPNASVDEQNFELNKDGSRDRRLGIDVETGHIDITVSATTIDIGSHKFNSFRWNSVNGLQNRDFIVIQIGTRLYFYDATASVISANYKGVLNLSTFSILERYSFTALEGKLVVVCGESEEIAIVSYSAPTSTFSVEFKRIAVRDLWGVEVTGVSAQYETDPSYRGIGDDNHRYNLYNQSWGIPRKNKAGTLADPTKVFFDDKTKYPSNIETVWVGLQYQGIVGVADPFERLYPNLWDDTLGSDVAASKGYFIIDLLRRGQSRMDNIVANKAKYSEMEMASFTALEDRTTKGASVVCEFAGRVFYSGFNGELVNGDKRSPVLNNFVLFSQLVKNVSDIVKCYQEGDPTSREASDVVDTDGGFIRVSGAENIVGMYNIGSHLIVIANNGVWAITGGSDYGFNATNYRVSKISNFGCKAPQSIVVEGGKVYFWSEDGIYILMKDKFGELGVDSLSKGTIQTYYEKISATSKQNVVGVYDKFSKKIKWLYREGTVFNTNTKLKELIFDTVIGSFNVHTIERLSNNKVDVIGMVALNEIPKSSIRDLGNECARYITLINRDGSNLYLGFAHHKDETFVDWKSVDGVGADAKAYVMTGAITAGDTAVAKQVPYLILHFRRTEDGVTGLVPDHRSSCKVRTMWDWSNSIVSNKWTPFFQAYRYRKPIFITGNEDTYDNGFDIVTTKNKIRGRGKAFSFYFETEPARDCRILGWNITLNGNGSV